MKIDGICLFQFVNYKMLLKNTTCNVFLSFPNAPVLIECSRAICVVEKSSHSQVMGEKVKGKEKYRQ